MPHPLGRNGCSSSLSSSIDISIDPFTGRNPSFCFVDFHTPHDVLLALTTMQGQNVRGRPVRLNYNTQRKRRQAQRDSLYVFDSWKRSDEAPGRWIAPHEEGRRLYVGGLPRIPHRSVQNEMMRELFRSWPIEAVSKLISPHPSTRTKPGDHYYCFVDLPASDLAEQAALALNGTAGPHGCALRVAVASRSYPGKVIREQFDNIYPGQDSALPAPSTRNLAGNWRSTESD